MSKFDTILAKIKQITGAQKDSEVAEMFGVSTGTMGSWKHRGGKSGYIPYDHIITFCNKRGIAFSRIFDDASTGLDDDILYIALSLQRLKEINKTQFRHIMTVIKTFVEKFIKGGD